MNHASDSRVRRKRARSWRSDEVDRLEELGLIEFLSEKPTTIRVSVQPEAESGVSAHRLSTEQVKALESELRRWDGRTDTLGHLRSDLEHVLGGICRHEGVLNVTWLTDAMTYVSQRLGLGSPLWSQYPVAQGRTSPEAKRKRLLERRQFDCFLEWADLDTEVWSDPVWRECILLLFDPVSETLVDALGSTARDTFDSEVEPGCSELLGFEATQDIIQSVIGSCQYGSVQFLIAQEYLTARAVENREMMQWLTSPIKKTPFFGLLAEGSLPCAKPQEWLTPNVSREHFLRYLETGQNDTRDLVGRVLYYLLRLEDWFGDSEAIALPEELSPIWPGYMRPQHLQSGAIFKALTKRYVDVLRIKPAVFESIWGACVSLTLRDFHRRRRSTEFTVFWAARILEAMRPEVYNAYREWIDHFGSVFREQEGMQPLDGAHRWALLGPFKNSLRNDPLLNAVFHSEVLGGRDQLAYRQGKRGADSRVVNLTLAYAERRLRDAWPDHAVPRVNDVLRSCSEIPSAIKAVVGDEFAVSADAVDVGPQSLYAYLTPMALALFGEELPGLTTRMVKGRCLDHRDDPEIMILLDDLPRELASALRPKQIG